MKKSTIILRAMNDIRADYILGGELSDQRAPIPAGSKTRYFRVLAVAAAALALVVAIGAIAVPMLKQDPVVPAETPNYTLQRVYKSHYADEAWGAEGATSMYVQIVDWAEHPEDQIFTLNGVDYPLTYQRSLYYPDQDSLMHEYALDIEGFDDSNSPYVMLTDEGALFRTGFFHMAQVDMSLVETDEELIELVEEAMADFADFDSYEFVEISSEGYRIIKWYNELGGYLLPNSISLGITQEGNINGLYMDVPHEITITKENIPSDDEIRALVAEDVKDTDMALHGPVQLGDVCHKEIIEQNGVECLYVYVESEYIFKTPAGKEYRNQQNLWYIIPIEDNLE